MVILTYVIAGALAGFAGFLLVGYTQNAGPNLGNQYLFPSIIAVAIGGTQMSGGKGSYFGTIAGAIVIQLITSLLTTMQLPQALQQFIFGSLLLVILVVYGREKVYEINSTHLHLTERKTMHKIAMLGAGFIGTFYTNTIQRSRSEDKISLVYNRTPETPGSLPRPSTFPAGQAMRMRQSTIQRSIL